MYLIEDEKDKELKTKQWKHTHISSPLFTSTKDANDVNLRETNFFLLIY